MKAIVTGGAGFIGSHLVHELLERGMDVHVIDNMSTGNLRNVPSHAVVHLADVASMKALDIVVKHKPDVLFHLAGQANVARSMTDPAEDTRVNVLGTVQMLHAAVQANVSRFVFASTASVYGATVKERLSETDPVEPVSFYAQSKWTSEHYVRLFAGLYGLKTIILRFSNVYGPRQMPQGEGNVIPLLLACLRDRRPLTIHGDGNQTRDFVNVRDVVAALIAAVTNGDNNLYHISTGIGTSINELARQLVAIHQADVPLLYLPPRAGDTEHSCLDNSKAKKELGWEPKVTLAAGLREAYTVYMNHNP
ncbi:NAD-dependent epimerase/dehydratase family protein [Paenibacillus xylaniclasticus]|uniref:NAD-dependent epimerase/dehydratase family protein n=1 Tax=Paenibacillus xylaniclasticus TaxID=588083 RepID=UPI000FDC3338|nr:MULTISPECIES: NAD-dependent epimerase/dehydratase family protein [Paenibacillus]GFN31671.1 UDP-glucose 4-epimerase [Paenibacillus curdlanolyticus]